VLVVDDEQPLAMLVARYLERDEHLVDVHVGHLRHKLGDDPAAPRFVKTVRGVGYRMGACS